MKHFMLFSAALLLAFVLNSCAKEKFGSDAIESETSDFISNAKVAGNVPSTTLVEWTHLLSDHESEAIFYEKLSFTTYALTEFIGTHLSHLDHYDLATVIPCDGLLDTNSEFWRVLSDESGMTVPQVFTELSQYLVPCIKGCENEPSHVKNTFFSALLNSLILETQQFDLIPKTPLNPQPASGNKIFLAYGVYSNRENEFVAGYSFHQQSSLVKHEMHKPFASGVSLNMILFDVVPGSSGDYLNDPCHYVGNTNSGGGSGHGGSGGGTYDDDGSLESSKYGPVVVPDSTDHLCSLSGQKHGLRMNRFHLADRNEGGLFSGKSEVYVNASVYISNQISNNNTTITNNGPGINEITETFWVDPTESTCGNDHIITCNFDIGAYFTKVSPSDISSQTNTVITPGPGEDWTIISEGFCEGLGFNRLFLTIYERDNVMNSPKCSDGVPHNDWNNISICRFHYDAMKFVNDTWFENRGWILRPSYWTNSNDILYLVEIPGGFTMQRVHSTFVNTSGGRC